MRGHLPKQTRVEFIRDFLAFAGITWEDMKDYTPVPCACESPNCSGWRMAHVAKVVQDGASVELRALPERSEDQSPCQGN